MISFSPPPPRERGADATTANRPLVLAAAAVTVVLWASAFVGIRAASLDYHPGSMALLRMAVGTVGLGLVAAATGFRPPRGWEWAWVAGWGLGWFAVYNLALNAAQRTLDAGTAAVIVNLAPLLVVVVAGTLLGEGFPRQLLLGVPLSFLGVILIGSAGEEATVTPAGLAMALLAAVLYAVCTLVQKRLLRTMDAASLTFVGAAAGTVALVPWGGQLVSDLSSAAPAATWSVVYLGVFPTAMAFTTWAYVLRRTSAGRTAATTYVVPVVTILLGWMILAEVPTPRMLLGAGLCLLGVLITRMTRPGPHHDAAGHHARRLDPA
ncbi:DMT family transporter [Ornithinimicrobium pratense]|uniref:DMT family transporter n=1 Tax=Ornithinimicrobium pratense TaxID=2593973 RepID=A0A5J6V3C4_9MICO|nr:DMT family transporter [Ornithinimicrobium pratense]QFG68188.1 DMT family transporter [Ornithinimicrobium pratense]